MLYIALKDNHLFPQCIGTGSFEQGLQSLSTVCTLININLALTIQSSHTTQTLDTFDIVSLILNLYFLVLVCQSNCAPKLRVLVGGHESGSSTVDCDVFN